MSEHKTFTKEKSHFSFCMIKKKLNEEGFCMKRGLNAICYEQEMHLYFERTTSLMEGEFYEIVLSDGQCIQTKKTNVSFYELKK